jgi:hypothetical protein
MLRSCYSCRPHFSAVPITYKIFSIIATSVYGQLGNWSEALSIEVTDVTMQKGTGVFGEFTFVKEGAKRGLFQYPHEYFGVTVRGTAQLHKGNCAPEAVVTNGINCIDK